LLLVEELLHRRGACILRVGRVLGKLEIRQSSRPPPCVIGTRWSSDCGQERRVTSQYTNRPDAFFATRAPTNRSQAETSALILAYTKSVMLHWRRDRTAFAIYGGRAR